MIYSRIFFLIICLVPALVTSAQSGSMIDFGGPIYIEKNNQLPEGLTKSRSVVMISVPDKIAAFRLKGDWKETAVEIHKTFRKIGVDAVAYVNYADLNSGPEVLASFTELFKSRRVTNLIVLEISNDSTRSPYQMTITELGEDGKITNGQAGWIERSSGMDNIKLRLGRQILRQELDRENFLIPEYPEFLDDLVVFKGNRLENYPSRLKSMTLAVPKFKKVSNQGIGDPEILSQIASYNQEVDQKNAKLEEILKIYPFKYKLLEETNDDKLYDMGYQYALMPITTSGKAAKKILNYPINSAETDYMTTSYDTDGNQKLNKIPVNALVTKYYIKQTIIKDIHTGDYWDAGLTWQSGLTNFIMNLRAAFKLSVQIE